MHISYIVPSFSFGTLTTSDFRWLDCDVWEPEHTLYFAKQRATLPQQALRVPPLTTSRIRFNAKAGGAWVLGRMGTSGNVPLAWAEAQIFPRLISTCVVGLGATPELLAEPSVLKSTFSLLLSAIFINSDCARIQVFSQGPTFATLDEFAWGEKPIAVQLLQGGVFRQDDDILQPCRLISLSAHDWWETANGAADQKTLAYLVRRQRPRHPLAASSQKRRSLLKILFRK